MDKPHLEARKAPKQARSQATVQAILTAGARVLAQESLAGFNTNRIAEVAGVSVGSLYQYFPNKAALAVALIDQERERLAVALEAAVASVSDVPLLEGLSRLARLAIEQQFQDPVQALQGASRLRFPADYLLEHRAVMGTIALLCGIDATVDFRAVIDGVGDAIAQPA
jgi:AcrR family transcriptional regulator